MDEILGVGAQSVHEQLATSLSGALHSGHFLLALLAAWVGGLLTSLTPCVYPLIPITVRYFAGIQTVKRRQVVSRAIVYVLGMAVFYGALGTAFAASHQVFGSFLAHDWVLIAIALFCVLMGMSMLGLFRLELPAAWSTRLSMVGGRGPWGALLMGMVSGLIAAPCTGPVLAVVLALVAATGALWQGFALMVFFALGLGVPFLVLAIFAGQLQRLPSSGAWMNVIKAVLATAMFVVALYFFSLAMPEALTLLNQTVGRGGLAVALILAAVVLGLLGGYKALKKMQPLFRGLAVGCVALSLSLWLFAGHEGSARALGIAWSTNHQASVHAAERRAAPMMIDFTAKWCQACQELEHKTFVDPGVIAEAKRFVPLRVDATEMTDPVNTLFDKYGVLGLPAVVFVDSKGNILKKPRITGFVPPQLFLLTMQQVR